jgi:hypothetical protein
MPTESNRKKRREAREIAERRSKMREEVFKRDHTCMDPSCECHSPNFTNPWAAKHDCAHILPKRVTRPELDEAWNGIRLCRLAHRRVEGGYKLNGVYWSGKQHMKWILDWWSESPSDPWGPVRAILDRKPKYDYELLMKENGDGEE